MCLFVIFGRGYKCEYSCYSSCLFLMNREYKSCQKCRVFDTSGGLCIPHLTEFPFSLPIQTYFDLDILERFLMLRSHCLWPSMWGLSSCLEVNMSPVLQRFLSSTLIWTYWKGFHVQDFTACFATWPSIWGFLNCICPFQV